MAKKTQKKAGAKTKGKQRTVPRAAKEFKDCEIAEVEVMVKTMNVRSRGVTLALEAKLEDLDINEAYDVLVDSRLNVLLEVDAHQEELFEKALPRLENVADCSKISVGVSTISWRLAFDAQSVDIMDLQPFLEKQATLWAAKVGRPEKKKKGDEDAEDELGDEDTAEAAAGKGKA